MDRSGLWLDWMGRVRAKLLSIPFGHAPQEAEEFFASYYAMHTPVVFRAPASPAMRWSLDSLRSKGQGIAVEVQDGRIGHPDYERQSTFLKRRMPFTDFLDRVEHDQDNAVYLTANNASASRDLLVALAPDLMPLPACLRQNPQEGFLWIGKGTKTPNHHDLTNNILVQLVGERWVRLIPPSQQPKLENHRWVYSEISWLDTQTAAQRRIIYRDIFLESGDVLFIPVGWFHCVMAPGISMMASFTNVWWHNTWHGASDAYPP